MPSDVEFPFLGKFKIVIHIVNNQQFALEARSSVKADSNNCFLVPLQSTQNLLTKDMHVCALCDTVGYKKQPMRLIGKKWVCIDCLRQLKETLDTMDQWEAEIQLEKEMSNKIDETLGL